MQRAIVLPAIVVVLISALAVQAQNPCDQLVACGTTYSQNIQGPVAAQNIAEICRVVREYFTCAIQYESSCTALPSSYRQLVVQLQAQLDDSCQMTCPDPAAGAFNSRRVCTVFGDPHLTTFDNRFFTVTSTSQTLFDDDWLTVRTTNAIIPGTTNIPWIKSVFVQYKNCTSFQTTVGPTGAQSQTVGTGAHVITVSGGSTTRIQLRGINTDILVSGTSSLRVSITSPFWQSAKGDCAVIQPSPGVVLDTNAVNQLLQTLPQQQRDLANQKCQNLPDGFKQGCLVDVASSGNASLASESQAGSDLHNDAVALGDGLTASDFALTTGALPLALGLSLGLTLAAVMVFIFLWLNKKLKEDPIRLMKRFPIRTPKKPTCCSSTQSLPVIRNSAIAVPAVSISCALTFYIVGIEIPDSGLIGAYAAIIITHVTWTRKTASSLGLLSKGSPRYLKAFVVTQFIVGLFTGVLCWILFGFFIAASIIEFYCPTTCGPMVEVGRAGMATGAYAMISLVFVTILFQIIGCAFIWIAARLLLQDIETPMEEREPKSKEIPSEYKANVQQTTYVTPVIAQTMPQSQQVTADLQILVEKGGVKQILNVGQQFLSSLEYFKAYLLANGHITDSNQTIEVWNAVFSEFVLLTDVSLITQNARIRI